jgi:enoyl-CoA hydratase
MDYQNIRYEQDAHVVTITLNRPDVHNCIDRATNDELQHAWKSFRDDDDAFVAVMTGAGEHAFCAGWDLNDAAALTEFAGFDQFRVDVYNSEGYCGYTRRADIFKPVIAAVNGYAFAAGLETALLADIRIGAENAEFGALERRWRTPRSGRWSGAGTSWPATGLRCGCRWWSASPTRWSSSSRGDGSTSSRRTASGW